MKYLLFVILTLAISQFVVCQIKIVDTKNYTGAIFPNTYDLPYSENPPLEKRFTPTTDQIHELETKLKSQIKKLNSGTHYDGPNIHKRLRNYVRQYIGYINDKGEKIIYISARWDGYSLWDWIRGYSKPTDDWKEDWIITFDGGSRYWQVKYNLSTKQFFEYGVNGVA